ncbi:MAG: RNA recognition motif domain-containing protein [Oligoflexales bacterium]
MNKIFVGGINWNTDERTLEDHFSQAGDVTEVKIIMDRETGRSRGFGFVTYSNSNDASNAVSKFDGVELDGKTLKVNIAEDKPRREGGNNRRW